MASPHVAGLMAYFMSLYPTSFDAETQDFSDEVYQKLWGTYQPPSAAQFVFGKLQQAWSGKAPVTSGSSDILSPIALKKALLKVSSKGKIIGDLPAGTPNLLIFK